MTETPPTLDVPMRAEHITKVFPGTTALDDVSFDVHAGQVNVLVGENGAGKSTLMKILAGVEQPTSGHVVMDGQPVELPTVTAAAQHGVGIIFQELNLCANLSVLDNLFLAQEMRRGAAIDRKAERQKARELLARLEQDIDPDELVSDLRIGQQQIVEIAKALTHDVRVLIMDEPTSALSQAEVQGLFRIIRDLKAPRRLDRLHLAQAGGAAPGRRPHHGAARRSRRGACEEQPTSTCPGSSSRWWAARRPRSSRGRSGRPARRSCASRT